MVSFTSTWSAPSGSPTELLLALQVEGGEFFEMSPEWIANTGTGGSERNAHGVGTVMWSFPHVAAGAYTVEATAHIAAFPGTSGQSGANLQACALTVFVTPASPTTSIPIGAGHVELNETFAFAGGFELGAFVPTGSDSNKCLVTLSESDFAISGTTVYCGVRQVDGQRGIFIHVLLPVPAPEHLVMSLTVYQEFARGYGQPVPFRG